MTEWPDRAPMLEAVQAAARRLHGRIHRTPVLVCRSFDEASGFRVFFKCENLQRAGSFKIRGALNRLLMLTDEERARGVAAFSSGNHAQGVALAARMVGTTALVCMPADAPPLKVEATRGYGAFGAVRCETEDGRATLCTDEWSIAEDGDPAVRLDTRARTLAIHDGDAWRLSLALDE